MTVYRQHEQPGCGGCLLIFVLLLLLVGGLPLVFQVVSGLLLVGFFLVLTAVGAFVAFSYYVKRQISAYEQSQTQTHNLFVTLLVHILVKIAAFDNQVTREEVAIIQNFFRTQLHYTHAQMLWVREIIKEARQSSQSLDELLAEFKQQFAYEPRLILLELVYQVLFSNASVSPVELSLADRIAVFLEIFPYDHQAIRSRYIHRQRQATEDEQRYFDILGLAPGASFAEIRAAYRKLSQQHHPDKVSHLGEEFKRVAEEKMKELNVAYQYLKKKYGG